MSDNDYDAPKVETVNTDDHPSVTARRRHESDAS